MLKFVKMHGLGNDFMVVDTTITELNLDSETIRHFADRRTGVGFDQLLIIGTSENPKHDFTYRIFNANGQEVAQCGNGARCVGRYIFTEKTPNKNKISLATISGHIEVQREEDGEITVNMGKPNLVPKDIPFLTERQALQYQLNLDDTVIEFGAVSLGNPHAVLRVNDVFKAPVQRIGQQLQHHPSFPKQVNVGFMEIISPDFIRLRVYERGVGETRSCGSGACAAVVIGRLCYDLQNKVTVELPGGSLTVNWQSTHDDIFITGPAEEVYKGEVAI